MTSTLSRLAAWWGKPYPVTYERRRQPREAIDQAILMMERLEQNLPAIVAECRAGDAITVQRRTGWMLYYMAQELTPGKTMRQMLEVAEYLTSRPAPSPTDVWRNIDKGKDQ